MTDVAKTGGYAFPVASGPVNGNGQQTNFPEFGMTLRDWFAGQALLGCNAPWFGSNSDYENVATAAYKVADAMLAHRAADEARWRDEALKAEDA